MARKLRAWLRHAYRVPWAVPAWGPAELSATLACLFSGRVVRGSGPERFAAALRRYLNVEFVLPVNRGRTAIELGLRAMRIGPGDDVVLPSYVCASVLEGVRRTGASPVFADVGDDLNLTPETVEAALTPGTKCVIVAHLFGKAAAIDDIERLLRARGIGLMDDAAQSLGARRGGRLVGTFGDCGIVSCGPGKTLAGAGGGALVTRDRGLYQRAAAIPLGMERAGAVARRLLGFWTWRRLRRYTLLTRVLLDRLLGEPAEPAHVASHIANVDAAIGLAQLTALESHDRHRRDNATRLRGVLGALADHTVIAQGRDDMLVKLILVLPPEGPGAESVIGRLAETGIECQPGYTPLHLGSSVTPLPFTESVWRRVVCVPVDVPYRGRAPTLTPAATHPPVAERPRAVAGESTK